MLRSISRALLITTIAGCSAKAPEAKETHNPPPAPIAMKQVSGEPMKAAPAGPAMHVDPREAALSHAVLELLEQQHLLRKHVDDALSRTAFGMYMDRIDASKMFLLKSDRDSLTKYDDKIDDELRAGSLDLAHEGERIYVARVAVVEKWVAEILGAPLDHTDEEFIELDPKKLEPAPSDQELRERWRRRLELEVMERVGSMEDRLAEAAKPAKDRKKNAKPDTTLDKIPKTPEERETKARTDLAKSYASRFVRLKTPGPLAAASELVNAVTASLDPHTDYLPPADKANFDIAMSGSLQGIGAVLREKDDYIEVVEIVPGGASARQGLLKANDLILAVEQDGQDPIDVVNMHIDDVVHMVRGKKGTIVRLHVRHPSGDAETISITRDNVVVEETYARGAVLMKNGQPYGYIHLPSFYGGKGAHQRTSAGDVGKLLLALRDKKTKGAIIDIRSNGGGLLGDAIEMSGEMIDKGPVVQVQDSRGRRQTLGDDQAGTDYDAPVIILVDKFSASASEILAAAMQDYGRAIIVGAGPGTHGKGTVQTVVDLDQATGANLDLGVLKMTIEQFFRVNGGSTQREGVTPDIVLPDPAANIESGEKTLEHAIPWAQVPAAAHDQWAGTWKIPALVASSAARVAKTPVFAKVNETMAVLKARKADTRIPLKRTAWDTWRKKEIAELEAVSPNLDKQVAKFKVDVVDEPAKPDERLTKWKEGLSRDPWVDECLAILGDMKK